MPWKEATKVDERRRMIEMAESGVYAKSELAMIFGVSRPTLDLWINRYREGEGLEDRLSRPKSCAHRTDESIVWRLIEAKREKPNWGPKKLIDWLESREPEVEWPAPSTAGEILDREGLVRRRRKRRGRIESRRSEPVEALESGEMMTADHKGQVRLGNRQLCYPLTVNDPVSRYSYEISALDSTSIENAQPVFENIFREYGLPTWIKTDNGSPFCASGGLGGLTRLSAWWIKLGIIPVRIRKGSPWQNGAHERMHRTLKADTMRPPAEDMKSQQERFDGFRKEYNHDRPHESLNGKAPVTVLKPCVRSFPARQPEVEYPGHFEVRRVRSDGRIKWRGEFLYVTEALVGEWVGLEEIDEGIWSLSFSFFELARYDVQTERLI